ncbi:MAG: DUF4162 domain-containing protein, partial [Promethearchaeota archaeon]
EDLKRFGRMGIKIKIWVNEKKEELEHKLLQQSFISEIENDSKGIIVSLKKRESYNDLLSILIKYPVIMIKELEESLEDLFLKIVA